MAGLVGWSPETFWAATLPELYYAVRGWQRANGQNPDDQPGTPMTRAELNDLMERFPDG